MKNLSTDDAALAALAMTLGEHLIASKQRLALAESCTGGWIAKVVTDIAGSSNWFDRGFVSYSNESKMELLGVSAELLAQEGAVSEAVVQEMAVGALQRSRADISIAVSGIAGPGGGRADKPVGTVCFAWGGVTAGNEVKTVVFPGDRENIRRQTVAYAFKHLLSLLHALGD